MKDYTFLKILKEILRFFEKVYNILSKFKENLENVGNMHFRALGRTPEIIKNN